jgi:hypothetical protein
MGALQSAVEPDCSWAASGSNNHTNLLGERGCKTLPEASLSPLESLEAWRSGVYASHRGFKSFRNQNMSQAEGIAYIKQVLHQG